jgi:hypothetical protein
VVTGACRAPRAVDAPRRVALRRVASGLIEMTEL